MKKILGLDLGTNSIGWALIEQDFEKKEGNILGMGSRIIPMSQDILGKFDSGQSHSQTAERTGYRGTRRLYQRDILRRERLHRVLYLLGFLPGHYSNDIDFEKNYGQFKEGKEPKISYFINEEGKHQFLFKNSFNEMVKDFRRERPELFRKKSNGKETKIPYDWTLYFLRKKALTTKIEKEALAWILLNFNQKRGYYQLRGEEEESNNSKTEEFYSLVVKRVEETEDKNAKGIWYNVVLENDWVYRRQSKESLLGWVGKRKEFIITTQLDKDGIPKTDKEGDVKRSFRSVDSERDWIAIKAKTEQDIENSTKTVGEFIYDSLLQDPKQKIRGKLVRTIERKYYKKELQEILKTQCSLHNELQNKDLYRACVEELYPRNEAHANNIKDKDFNYLFIDDIIFYQRPLKSKKSSISSCTYETRTFYKSKETIDNGKKLTKKVKVTEGIKAIPKSHPLFQEFRLWQFLSYMRIYKQIQKGELDITSELLPDENSKVRLFDFLNNRKEVEQKNVVDYFIKDTKQVDKLDKGNYRWNYMDKAYPCNETQSQFVARLRKVTGIDPDSFLTKELTEKLWHIIYSVKDKVEYEKALSTFAREIKIDETSFIEAFKRFKPFENDYGAYSYKALKKILPLLRLGKYWKKEDIHQETFGRIEKIVTGEVDSKIAMRVREKAINLESVTDFRGLPVWLACYVVYDRHSESGDNIKWNRPEDIDKYLSEFKQHSLRNPIVEQVVTETLRTVRDIWQYYGENTEGFFNEIHVELGRSMKNPADKRKRITIRNTENENTNQRIRELLTELVNDEDVKGDVRPYSPSHQEILKIYEEGVYQNPNASFNVVSNDDIEKIRKASSPSNSDIKRYKLWLEQGYRSPYTGEVIRLSELFTEKYQIEHIIPQSRYFDDSLSNKVICESIVNGNPYKDNQTGFEFIKNNERRIVPELSKNGVTVKIFSLEEYETHCNQYFRENRAKLHKLLSEDIPEGFIQRQMNDSRYISKLIKSLLSNVVKENDEQEATSKNIVPVTGAITSKLKQDWGLNDKWNEIVAPRFMRLNELTRSNKFGYFDKSINAFRCEVPDDLKRNFSKKRIDHRHHALDALVIACVTKDHVNYLNSIEAEKRNYSLRNKLLIKSKNDDYTKAMQLPWRTFPADALIKLQTTIVSFKQNLRVINKTNNKYWKWKKQSDGSFKKELVSQTKGDNWAIRKPMHKETVSGFVNVQIKKEVSFSNGLKEWRCLVDKNLKSKVKRLYINGYDAKSIAKYFKTNPYMIDGKEVKKVSIYSYTKNSTATRTNLADKFTRKQLERITDSGIRRILEKHIENYIDENGKECFDLAFSPDGIDDLNKNIKQLNNGVMHQPIYKVRIYEEGSKFQVGFSGNKSAKYVEAAKGTNLFYAVYWNEEKQKREFDTVPLNEVIEHQKQESSLPKEGRTHIPVKAEKGNLRFVLSPNDLVYVPTDEEIERGVNFDGLTEEQTGNVYKVVSFTGNRLYGIEANVASSIWDKNEYSSLNKLETDILGRSLKNYCWKLKVDRLGIITNVIR